MFATLWGDADQKENPIMMGLLDNVPGAPNSVSATEPFSDLQAQLSPSALYCCLPRTTTWYSITVAHLKAVNWQKSAIEALVLHEPTKQLLCDLVEEHKKGRLTGSLSDFIRNKGEVSHITLYQQICELHRTALIQVFRPLSWYFMALQEWARL